MTFVRPHIQRMEGYTYGEQPSDRTIIKLNTNENPYPPSPSIKQFLDGLDLATLRLYPDPTASTLRSLISEHYGLNPDQVVITNGADEGIRLVMTTFLEQSDVVAVTEPGYTLYEVVAKIHNARIHRTVLSTDWQLPANSARDWDEHKVKVGVIVNPHAPTGRYFDENEIRKLAEGHKGILLLDEAYIDFVDPAVAFDSTQLLAEFPNVLILRTFSKGYSLAGLRLGYLMGAIELLDPILFKTRDSYNVDAIAQGLAQCAFRDKPHHRQNVERVRNERTRLTNAARQLGYRVPDSETNFILLEHPSHQSVADTVKCLRDHKILVRYFNTPTLQHCLRVTIGTAEQNNIFLKTLSKVSVI